MPGSTTVFGDVSYGPSGEIAQFGTVTRTYNVLGQLTRITKPGAMDLEYRFATLFNVVVLAMTLVGGESPQRDQLFKLFAAAPGGKSAPGSVDSKVRDIWLPRFDRMEDLTPGQFVALIRSTAQGRATFAGRYAIVSFGCGSGCRQIGIVDVVSGRVRIAPFDITTCRVGEGVPLDYRLTSRLLIVEGRMEWFPDESSGPKYWDCGTYYFEWTGRELRQVWPKPDRR